MGGPHGTTRLGPSMGSRWSASGRGGAVDRFTGCRGTGADGVRPADEQHVRQVAGVRAAQGAREHQAALQAIADANGGTRAVMTPGYAASVDYVVDTLKVAGWAVSLDEFDFTVAEPIRQ